MRTCLHRAVRAETAAPPPSWWCRDYTAELLGAVKSGLCKQALRIRDSAAPLPEGRFVLVSSCIGCGSAAYVGECALASMGSGWSPSACHRTSDEGASRQATLTLRKHRRPIHRSSVAKPLGTMPQILQRTGSHGTRRLTPPFYITVQEERLYTYTSTVVVHNNSDNNHRICAVSGSGRLYTYHGGDCRATSIVPSLSAHTCSFTTRSCDTISLFARL